MTSIKRKKESIETERVYLIQLRRQIESTHQDTNTGTHGCKIKFVFAIDAIEGLPSFDYSVERVCSVDLCAPDVVFDSHDLDTDEVIVGEPYETIGMPDIDSLRMYDLPKQDRKKIYDELQAFVDAINDLIIGSMDNTDLSSFNGRAKALSLYRGFDISIARSYIIDAWAQVVRDNIGALKERGIDVMIL